MGGRFGTGDGGGGPARSAPVAPSRAAVATAFAAVDRALDALMEQLASLECAGDDAAWTREEAEALVGQAAVLTNRAARVRSRVVSVVGRARERGRLHHLDDAQLAAGAGRVDRGDARRDRSLADALGNRAPTGPRSPGPQGADGMPRGDGAGGAGAGSAEQAAPRFPLLAAWCDAGRVGERQAVIVVEALDGLPADLTAEQRTRAEEVLVEWAATTSPTRLRRRASRVLAELGLAPDRVDTHENDQVAARERAAWENTRLWMVDKQDGTWEGRFTLPELQAHMLKKALDALTSPTRRTGSTVEGRSTGDVRFDKAWWDQQRGRALCELIDHLPTDGLASKINAVLLVRTDLETLRGETDRAGVTDSGATLSAGEVRRLAAAAGIVPAVLGTRSQVLDLGRQTRCFTDSQRSALALRYDTCAAQDCERPFAWTQIHHATPWEPVRAADGTVLHPGGGRTDLGNAIPLCGPHHRQLDDPRLRHTIDRHPDGTAVVRFDWRKPGEPWSSSAPAGGGAPPGSGTPPGGGAPPGVHTPPIGHGSPGARDAPGGDP